VGHNFLGSKRFIIIYLSALFWAYSISLKKTFNFEFWTIFGTYFFNSTYTRVDLYASIYGNFFSIFNFSETKSILKVNDLVILRIAKKNKIAALCVQVIICIFKTGFLKKFLTYGKDVLTSPCCFKFQFFSFNITLLL
jgi:hypothetical protein